MGSQAESMADDIEIELEAMKLWTTKEARAYFESGGTERPNRWSLRNQVLKADKQAAEVAAAAASAAASAPQYYQMDMFGIKRGCCQRKKKNEPPCECKRFQPRVGLQKTEGLNGLAIAKCANCGHENLDHEDLGRWVQGEAQLFDETGKWTWIMSHEGQSGVSAKAKKVRMDED